MIDLNPHFKIIKSIGPKPMDLYEISMSDKLKDAVSNNKFLEAIRLGIGVNEYNSLLKGSSIGQGTQKLLTYTG